jgi:hypothetical protein
MSIILSTVVGILVVLMIFLVLSVRIIKQYEQGCCSAWVGCWGCALRGSG